MLSIRVLNRDHLDASSPRNVLLAGAQYTARSAAGKSRPLTAGQNSRLISASEYRRHFICDRARLRSPRPIVVAVRLPPNPAAPPRREKKAPPPWCRSPPPPLPSLHPPARSLFSTRFFPVTPIPRIW